MATARRSVGREYLEALLIAVIFATFVRTFVVQAFKIPSGSMEQNLLIGDHILVNKFIYGPAPSGWERTLLPVRDPRHGDVIVFKFPDEPERDFIKRCIGLPGDTVEIVDKELFVDRRRVHDEGYTYHVDQRIFSRSQFQRDAYRPRDNFGPYEVPAESYFFLGDNRDLSHDSRYWQRTSAPREYLKGRALMIYWSFDTPEALRRAEANGEGGASLGRRLAAVGRNFFSRTRWDRTFHVVR